MKIETESFFNKIITAFKAELPFVGYRHPKTNSLKGFFQKDATLHTTKTYDESGFVFAPFDDDNSSILFPLTESTIYTTHFSEDYAMDKSNKRQSPLPENSRPTHIKLVQKGIDFLRTAGVEKVVLSRKEIIEYPNFDVIETFQKLLVNYSSAMVYVWFHPKVGLWLGATPETLLKVQNDQYTTMALAGTQSYKESLDVVWKNKEQQEQQFVTDYIVEKLGSHIEITEPQTIRAGNLVHLCTIISGKLSKDVTLNRIIKLLHPTPAVCGLPMAKAKAFILENEPYNREFYTGFLGELRINNTSNLFVNLRCMQVLENALALYIGGGITMDSILKKEWEETVAKSKVMLKVLG